MNNQLIITFLQDNNLKFLQNEQMNRHTSFKVGGCADFFVTVQNADEVKKVYDFCNTNNIPLTVIGKGSNILVSDSGIEGVVLTLEDASDTVVNSDDSIICSAGMSLTALCLAALKNGLSGLEFAYGIPGSVGGAVYMNAGAYGGEIKDVILSATVLSNGEIKEILAQDMQLGYRTSVFKTNGDIILSVKFKLTKGSCDDIKSQMTCFMNRRREKQPLEFPSAGSTFKRPEGHFAGALIEGSALKGYTIGGAQVSEKHAGFVINKGNATSRDIKLLISHIQATVLKNSGVELEREVIYIGREES